MAKCIHELQEQIDDRWILRLGKNEEEAGKFESIESLINAWGGVDEVIGEEDDFDEVIELEEEEE